MTEQAGKFGNVCIAGIINVGVAIACDDNLFTYGGQMIQICSPLLEGGGFPKLTLSGLELTTYKIHCHRTLSTGNYAVYAFNVA